MYKFIISPKLAAILRGGTKKIATSKVATEWDDLSYEVQAKYLRDHPDSKRKITARPHQEATEYKSMTISEIQATIADYQKNLSAVSFKKLYKNFLPLILKTVKGVVGSRHPSHEDLDDLKQSASIIFAKSIEPGQADPTNVGVIKYIQKTLNKQLMGKAREIFRPDVTIGPKDRRALRAIQRYMFKHMSKHDGQMPTDFEQMSRDINADPTSRVTHITPDLITDLLQSGSVSLDAPVGTEGADESREVHEVLGQEQLADTPVTFKSPEEETIGTELKQTVEKSIESLEDPEQRRVLELFFGFDNEHPEAEQNLKTVAQLIGKPRKTTRRILERAQAALRGMKDIQKLRTSKSILRIIKAFNKHIKFAYIPEKITKFGTRTFIVDDKFTVKRYGSQLICSCGKNCFHKNAVRSYLRKRL